ncbi:MAG: dihydroorotate dehydrogenase electron transfer subunit [Prevotella sp.]|nr:dihydroorotate dehydrogenase electron transfer subunit [Prevotella sp.]MBO4658621.1 dihydroorotate dehydrogenase electron transfer subunit [Prevotella sp.]
MKKYLLDLKVVSVEQLGERHVLIKLTHDTTLPEMMPGQFAELRVDGSPKTFLRRPISINFVDEQRNEVWLLVAMVGDGTCRLASLRRGDFLNCVIPLGNGFSLPADTKGRYLLVGGGVGVAPLLFLGDRLRKMGCQPTFLLGARRKEDLLQLSYFEQIGRVLLTTEDGSAGEKGFVTSHSILSTERYDRIYTCGPKPMMMAVAKYARNNGIFCEVSLENKMACGLGACLCCVENTTEGNLCVCTDGPVLNINQLLWPI